MTDLSESAHEDLQQDMSERASTLYWHSTRSVNSIADDLGLSKGRLYDLIRPLGSGQDCSNCQSELVFTNRTAQERDEPICPVCDAAGVPAATVGAVSARTGEPPATTASSGRPATNGAAAARASRAAAGAGTATDEALSSETRNLVTGLVVGAVAGVLLGRYFLR